MWGSVRGVANPRLPLVFLGLGRSEKNWPPRSLDKEKSQKGKTKVELGFSRTHVESKKEGRTSALVVVVERQSRASKLQQPSLARARIAGNRSMEEESRRRTLFRSLPIRPPGCTQSRRTNFTPAAERGRRRLALSLSLSLSLPLSLSPSLPLSLLIARTKGFRSATRRRISQRTFEAASICRPWDLEGNVAAAAGACSAFPRAAAEMCRGKWLDCTRFVDRVARVV